MQVEANEISISCVIDGRDDAPWVTFITGIAPGYPRQTGHTLVFGAAPKRVLQAQNIFDWVLSWTWTSRPIEAR